MARFNIGDRVVIKSTGSHGKVTYYNEFWDDYNITLDDGTRLIMVEKECLEHESSWNNSNFKVVITGNKDASTIRYYKGSKLAKEKTVKRCSENMLDDEVDIKLAVAKLFPAKEAKEKSESKIENVGYLSMELSNHTHRFMGYVGTPSGLKTIDDIPLMVGDIVNVYKPVTSPSNGHEYLIPMGSNKPVVRPNDKAYVLDDENGKYVYDRTFRYEEKYDGMHGNSVGEGDNRIVYKKGESK